MLLSVKLRCFQRQIFVWYFHFPSLCYRFILLSFQNINGNPLTFEKELDELIGNAISNSTESLLNPLDGSTAALILVFLSRLSGFSRISASSHFLPIGRNATKFFLHSLLAVGVGKCSYVSENYTKLIFLSGKKA